MRILLLGGTTEASALVKALAGRPGLAVTLSLAGRTSSPKPEPVPTRIGGFGGAEGLARWLARHGTDLVVDATHPFADQMSRNAAEACAMTGVPLLAIRRPPWEPGPGDRWTVVPEMAGAVEALGAEPRCVFLTVGRLELAPFAAAPQHRYVVRTIEPLEDVLPVPRLVTIQERGPFEAGHEAELMRREGVEILVTKNSGGAATYGKLAAARESGIPVVMVARPDKPDVPSVATPDEALAWIQAHVG